MMGDRMSALWMMWLSRVTLCAVTAVLCASNLQLGVLFGALFLIAWRGGEAQCELDRMPNDAADD